MGTSHEEINQAIQNQFRILTKQKRGSSHIYKLLIYVDLVPPGVKKWEQKYDENIHWRESIQTLKQTTRDTKLMWFQIRIIQNILTTNNSVSKFNKSQSPLCSFCNKYPETIIHLMWECHVVKLFWENLEKYINKTCPHAINFKFNKEYVLFSTSSLVVTDKICNLITLLAKFFIYRNKIQGKNLKLLQFKSYLYKRYCIEKEISTSKLKENEFTINWLPYSGLFKSSFLQRVKSEMLSCIIKFKDKIVLCA